MQDDAFIFFRYARNTVRGQGLVWNPGEPVEGYTSFAWVLMLAAVMKAGVPIEWGAHVLTVGLALASLGLLFGLAWSLARSPWAGAMAVWWLATDRCFVVWSTSGMDTRLFGTLALAVLTVAHGELAGTRRTILLGGLLLGMSLTRPEGLLLAGVVLLGLLVARPRSWQPVLAASAIWSTGVGGHALWRHSTYGAWLPNTFHAKVPGLQIDRGLAYLADFAASFPQLALLVLAVAAAGLLPGQRSALRWIFLGFTAFYLSWLACIGGDVMEFRMVDLLLAPLFALAAADLSALARWLGGRRGPMLAGALAVLVAGVNMLTTVTFERGEHVGMTRHWMWEEFTRPWISIGHWFGQHALPAESLATQAAGAIPYYADLPAVDMLGLNDATIAHLPHDPDSPAGHQRVAPDSYLAERRVTYVLGHPVLMLANDPFPLPYDEIGLRIPNEDPTLLGGEDFWLVVRTTGSLEALARSLEERGVEVLRGEPRS